MNEIGLKNEKELPAGPALYVVAVPIGNLEDITLRALRILQQTDMILSEDTRVTGRLLHHHGIQTQLKSYRIHRREEDDTWALEQLSAGRNLCLCTDAGTPGISDPGSHLVRFIRESAPHIPIFPIPGPSALSAAMSVSGFQANPSVFLGFLSPKSSRRRRALEAYRDFEGCIILMESVHRIKKTLRDVRDIFSERDTFIAREMTKLHEEYIMFRAGMPSIDENSYALDDIREKGEFTVMIGPLRKISNE